VTVASVEGLSTFDATTDAAIRDLESLDGEEAGRVVQLRAAANAPKASGTLANSIRAESSGTEVSVMSDLVYAPVQEFGWPGHSIAAQPYMRPALLDSRSAVEAVYARDVSKAVGSIRGA
jgi:hypothetical protein